MPLGEFVGKGLETIIEQQKTTILKKWFDAAIQAYAPDTAKFLKNQKDPFGNPVSFVDQSTLFKGSGD